MTIKEVFYRMVKIRGRVHTTLNPSKPEDEKKVTRLLTNLPGGAHI